MSSQSSPEMSVIVVADRYQTIRKTIRHLRTQTVKDRREIVIVAPSREQLGLSEAELEDFLHCYPEPGWAVALIEAHRKGWDVVGPVMGNANPQSLTSWASFFAGLGRWTEPAVAGEIDDLPPHNSSYKRTMLLDYGPALEAMLEVESLLHQDLRAKGHRLYWEPAAKVRHVSYTSLLSLMQAEFHYGRLFAAARMRRWSLLRRLMYTIGGPLIPLVRLRRVLREIQRAGHQRQLLPGVFPALIVILASNAVGEMCGYAFGAGNASQQRCTFDLDRYRHLAKRDRQVEAG